TRPLDYNRELPIEMQRWNFADPNAPVALRAHEADTGAMQRLPAIYEDVGGELRPVLDWRRARELAAAAPALPAGFFLAPDVPALEALRNDPERQLMGPGQEQWVSDELAASVSRGAAWQVIGNQVMVAPVTAPDLSRTPAELAAALERLLPGVTRLLKFTRFPLPLGTDSWDGYPASRARLYQAIRAAGGNTLVLTGDTHVAWANELEDAEGRLAVEL